MTASSTTQAWAGLDISITCTSSFLHACRFLGERGLKDYEAAILCNLKPEDKDEAFTLLPSLKVSYVDIP